MRFTSLTILIIFLLADNASAEEKNYSPGELILRGVQSLRPVGGEDFFSGEVTIKTQGRALPVQYIKISLDCQNGLNAETSTDKDGIFDLPFDAIKKCKDGKITVVSLAYTGSRQLTDHDKKNLELFKIEVEETKRKSHP
jgi:hypothetical protein